MVLDLIVNTVSSSGGILDHNLLCGLVSSILGGFISGFITWKAMKSTDKENKERWQKDSFSKYKGEKVLDLYIKLNSFCVYARENASLDDGKIREIMSIVKEHKNILKSFLNEEEIAIFPYLDVASHWVQDGDDFYLVDFNDNVLPKLKELRDKLCNKMFE